MIKEYIDKLFQDNEEEIKKQENQMKNLMNDLESTHLWLEELQKENSVQLNIFSPRNIDEHMGQKIQDAQDKMEKIKQQIEYTREMLETHIKKKHEYEMLLKEAGLNNNEGSQNNNESSRKSGDESSDVNCELKNVNDNINQSQANDLYKNENEINHAEQNYTETTDNSEDENQTAELTESVLVENSEFVNRLKSFVNDIYRKNEISLAFLNSDKNKSKNEMIAMKKTIKEFAVEIENTIKK